MHRQKVGFYSLSSCGGCLLEILDSPLIDSIIDKALILMRGSQDSSMDICFVAGSAITEEEREELAGLRKRSRILVSLGACADGTRDGIGLVDVEADYVLHGCPADIREIGDAIAKLLSGRQPVHRDRPVCADCRERESSCLLLKSAPCLGPVTRGGCDAICTANNTLCIGCRGYCSDRSLDAFERKGPEGTADLLRMMRNKDAGTER
jgi:sulfhydrogenase subunit delta